MKQNKWIVVLQDLELNQHKNFKAIVGKLKVSNLLTNERRILKPEIKFMIISNFNLGSIQTNFQRLLSNHE